MIYTDEHLKVFGIKTPNLNITHAIIIFITAVHVSTIVVITFAFDDRSLF
jgi:hypothetical protein